MTDCKKAWSEEDHLSWMASANISKSILSITSPGTNLDPTNATLAKDLSRRVNEFAADIKRRRPEQFGFFASLPLPDVEASLAEIAYALDELDADGVALLTNFHGMYLGDDALRPVFDELEKRGAVVFIHPTSPCIGDGVSDGQPASPLDQYPIPMFEYLFETARATMHLFLAGVVDRSPSVTFIITHAGGALPPLVDRFTNFASSLPNIPGNVTPAAVKAALKRQFYFDLAGFPFPDQIRGLSPGLVGAGRLLYGSDIPYTPPAVVVQLGKALNAGIAAMFPADADQAAILRGNAGDVLGTA